MASIPIGYQDAREVEMEEPSQTRPSKTLDFQLWKTLAVEETC